MIPYIRSKTELTKPSIMSLLNSEDALSQLRNLLKEVAPESLEPFKDEAIALLSGPKKKKLKKDQHRKKLNLIIGSIKVIN